MMRLGIQKTINVKKKKKKKKIRKASLSILGLSIYLMENYFTYLPKMFLFICKKNNTEIKRKLYLSIQLTLADMIP